MHWSQVSHTILPPDEYIVAIASLFKGHFKHPSGSLYEQKPRSSTAFSSIGIRGFFFQLEKLCSIVRFVCRLFCKFSHRNANKSSHLVILFKIITQNLLIGLDLFPVIYLKKYFWMLILLDIKQLLLLKEIYNRHFLILFPHLCFCSPKIFLWSISGEVLKETICEMPNNFLRS